MGNITRDRGCAYYVPWIATLCTCLGIAALGVWIYFTQDCRDKTRSALEFLDVDAKNVERLTPGLIGTAIAYIVLILIIYFMSLWRSFIEAAHDATGTVAKGVLGFLVLCFLVSICWWAMCLWLGLLLMANSLWALSLYLMYKSIDQVLYQISVFGSATWRPSANVPCPGQCLDLTTFSFISAQLQDACVCDEQKLAASRGQFRSTFDEIPGVTVGNWVMLAVGICLLVNLACTFSHTKRERELLMRVAAKSYSSA